MSIELRSLRKLDRSVFTQWISKFVKKCMGSYGSFEKWRENCCIMIDSV